MCTTRRPWRRSCSRRCVGVPDHILVRAVAKGDFVPISRLHRPDRRPAGRELALGDHAAVELKQRSSRPSAGSVRTRRQFCDAANLKLVQSGRWSQSWLAVAGARRPRRSLAEIGFHPLNSRLCRPGRLRGVAGEVAVASVFQTTYPSAPLPKATSYPFPVCSAPTGVQPAANSPVVTTPPLSSSSGPVPLPAGFSS